MTYEGNNLALGAICAVLTVPQAGMGLTSMTRGILRENSLREALYAKADKLDLEEIRNISDQVSADSEARKLLASGYVNLSVSGLCGVAAYLNLRRRRED